MSIFVAIQIIIFQDTFEVKLLGPQYANILGI